ncbi:tetratricopeptide repeat protein [Nocardia sp. NPDC051463]|uniref:tetratricopeptide repeat protein n=1 Tax=Nocardia sp. NPDC051463 TaxID=3154845 RepID=UPI003414069D
MLSNLATSRALMGNYTGAVADYQQVYDGRARVLGPDNPDTLRTLDMLADTRASAGDHEGAAADFKQLLDTRNRVLGPEHEETLRTRGDLIHQQSLLITAQQQTLDQVIDN